MCRRLTLLISTLLLSLHSLSQAQQPRMGEVLCSLLDSEGCWWYGTQGGGLCRDDGTTFEVFRSDREHPDFLGSNDVTCLAECRAKSEIWFGTKKGAYVLGKQDRSLRPLLQSELADMRLNCMMEASDGLMWVAYRNTLLEIDAQTDSVCRRFELSWKGKRRSVVALTQDRSGTIWLSLWNGGLCRLLRTTDTFEPCPWNRDDYCTTLRYDSVRSCVVAQTSTGDRLMVRRGETEAVPDVDMSGTLRTALLRHAPPRDSLLIAYTETRDSICYLGTFHSLYRYALSTDSLSRLPFETGRVRDLTVAADGTLFFLSREMGLCQLRGDSAEVLMADANFRSLELRSDTLLWLTDGVGNASTFDLCTRRLTPVDLPQVISPDSSSHSWLWLLLLLAFPPIIYLIHKQKQRIESVSTQEEPTPETGENNALSAADQEFVDRARAAVMAHLSDADYAVDALASDLCMSRVALYRRLRQVCGQTPTDFLRNLRLDRAAELLRTTGSSVNEVADMVGFSYASYFTRCFKERFGVAPKDYR